MYLNSRVKIPSDKGKISIKSVRGYQYVYYQYDTNYRPERKYNMPRRTTMQIPVHRYMSSAKNGAFMLS